MCGIGIFNEKYENFYKIDHRGVTSNQRVLNGLRMTHSLLPIQTYENLKIMPYEVNTGRFLLYNGEIFNFYEFGDYNSDTEYLIDFFKKKNMWDLKEINKWDGFWSICLIDGDDVYAFTDPLGKKQLYYNTNGICSEIKPLLDFKQELNYKGIYGNGFLKETYFQGVERIPPNNIMIFKDALKKGIKNPLCYISNYFFLKNTPQKGDLKDLIEMSIKDRLINKMDDISVFVSGGLDSTILLHNLLKLVDKDKLDVLTIQNGEEEYVEILEDWYDIKIRRIPVNIEEYMNAILVFEHPIDFGSLLPQYNLFREAKNRVVFTGDGADELFSGYSRALIKDTQDYDVFYELPYFHHIRLDRCSMRYTKECRNPFLSTKLIRYALQLPYSVRKGKEILKKEYLHILPTKIITREKQPLRAGSKNESNRTSKEAFIDIFSSGYLFNKDRRERIYSS